MEQDREGTAGIRTGERLTDGEGVVEDVLAAEGAAAADELVDERARRAQRSRRGECREWLPFLGECDVRDDRRFLRIRGWGRRDRKARESKRQGQTGKSAHRPTSSMEAVAQTPAVVGDDNGVETGCRSDSQQSAYAAEEALSG